MWRICRFHEIDSTNAEAIRRARAGEAEGAVFLAETQTAGRGRNGAVWESPPGKNLYLTFLLRPPVSPTDAVPITRVAAFAIREALQRFVQGLEIKWPNDILLNGKKVAGILSEMETRKGETSWVVCGIGINVNSDPEDFSLSLREVATSLKIAAARGFDREAVLQAVLEEMEKRYGRFKEESSRD